MGDKLGFDGDIRLHDEHLERISVMAGVIAGHSLVGRVQCLEDFSSCESMRE